MSKYRNTIISHLVRLDCHSNIPLRASHRNVEVVGVIAGEGRDWSDLKNSEVLAYDADTTIPRQRVP